VMYHMLCCVLCRAVLCSVLCAAAACAVMCRAALCHAVLCCADRHSLSHTLTHTRRAHTHTPQIPVVIFQLNRKQAVLIDEHYNGRAVDDVVLVVSNAAHE
jgi:hypothetical protein